eukprot:10023154-Lingulodinium_polyedra.AAC.1
MRPLECVTAVKACWSKELGHAALEHVRRRAQIHTCPPQGRRRGGGRIHEPDDLLRRSNDAHDME